MSLDASSSRKLGRSYRVAIGRQQIARVQPAHRGD